MRFSFFTCCLLFICNIASYCQSGIKGLITDKMKNPVPFAVVYDETSLTGASANSDGIYEMKLENGKHSLVIKAMGYYPVRRTITLNGGITTENFLLDEQPLAIKEVIVTPGKEDPAYPIMRKVIGLAPYHLNQVKTYLAEVYLRGTIHVEKIPKFISKHTELEDNNGTSFKLRNGDVFMTESLNKIEFHAPDKYTQTVLSIHSTFPGNESSVNPMDVINSSLYEPEVADFISPLAPNAFHYYNYAYEGFFDEGKSAVFKIKVTPKRNSQQLVNGYVFIVDQLWCLHSADLSAEMFFGKINIKAMYSPVKNEVWLPVSYQFVINTDIMGVKVNFSYNSSVKYKQVELNEKKVVPDQYAVKPLPEETSEKTEKTKNQQTIEKIMQKEALTNRDMIKLATLMAKEASADSAPKTLEIKAENNHSVIVEKNAVNKDTGYWNEIRPIPLTRVESSLPAIRLDTLSEQSGKKSTSAVDSSAFKKSLKAAAKFITDGAGFNLFNKMLYVHYDGLVGFKKLDFNTVDGVIFRQTLSLDLKTDSIHTVKINPGAAYAFSRKQFMWWTDLSFQYAPMHNGRLDFYIGSRSVDFNSESGINSTVNSLSSLFFRRNYMKLYQENMIRLQHTIDIVNGLNFETGIGYRFVRPLENYSDFSFFFRDARTYSDNVPDLSEVPLLGNPSHHEAFWEVNLKYTPQFYYRVSHGKKVYQHSKYPTFYLHNKMAIPGILNSTANYDLLEIGAMQKMEWGMMHAFRWDIKGGFFLNDQAVYTMNVKFFNNQDIPVIIGNSDDAFRLVPYYRNATSGSFAEMHLRFTTPYLLIKYLPFLSNKLWCENIHLNYLSTGAIQHYWEAGYSVSQIFFTAGAGVFAGFVKGSFQSAGIQFSIDL